MSEQNTEGGKLEQLFRFYLKKDGFSIQDTTNTKADYKEGTDMIVAVSNLRHQVVEYRLDPTTNFQRKLDEGLTTTIGENRYMGNAVNYPPPMSRQRLIGGG